MSDTAAIASATESLRALLSEGVAARDASLAGVRITTLPPYELDAGEGGASLNLYLFGIDLGAATGNATLPGRTAPPGVGPLTLTLRFLVTAYAPAHSTGAAALRALGAAMAVLHDNPRLAGGAGGGAPLTVRPLAIGTEEMSRIWGAFGADYRLSVGYELGPVTIDTARAGAVRGAAGPEMDDVHADGQ